MDIGKTSNYMAMPLDHPMDEVTYPAKKTHKSGEFLKPPTSANVTGHRFCGVDMLNTPNNVEKKQEPEVINKSDSLISRFFRWASLSIGIY